MYDNYGREIYTTLQSILSLLQDWQADSVSFQTALQEALQNGFDLLFSVICIIAVFIVASVAMRLFFPGYRD